MVICLEPGADLQLMPLPLTVSCFSKIQIGFTFLVPAHPGSPGHRAVKRVCVTAYPGSPGQNAVKRLCIWTDVCSPQSLCFVCMTGHYNFYYVRMYDWVSTRNRLLSLSGLIRQTELEYELWSDSPVLITGNTFTYLSLILRFMPYCISIASTANDTAEN